MLEEGDGPGHRAAVERNMNRAAVERNMAGEGCRNCPLLDDTIRKSDVI
jgi:hypothetical protein